MTSSNGDIFRVTGHLRGEFTASPVNSPHKGQWRGALMFSLICVWMNGWVNNREAGDLIRHRAHYDAIVMDHECAIHTYRLLFWIQGSVCILGYISTTNVKVKTQKNRLLIISFPQLLSDFVNCASLWDKCNTWNRNDYTPPDKTITGSMYSHFSTTHWFSRIQFPFWEMIKWE